jgi:hypothetical protein
MYGILTGISEKASTKGIILTHTLLVETVAPDGYGLETKKH